MKRIAIIVDPALAPGFLANTVATIAVGIGAAAPEFGNIALTDVAAREVRTSADRPIPILQAPSETIRALLLKALPAPEGAIVVPFPQFARALHVFGDYQAQFPTRDLATETIEGLGLAGEPNWVKALTGSLKLLR
jgi:hypothetical protein